MINNKFVLSFFCFFIILFSLGCDVEVYVEKPDKPKGIPVESFWVGGPDGGVFLFLKERESSQGYYAEVFYQSGDLAYKGGLKLKPNDKPNVNLLDESYFLSWDGDRIYLKDGRYLETY